jgi:hypothetical protein
VGAYGAYLWSAQGLVDTGVSKTVHYGMEGFICSIQLHASNSASAHALELTWRSHRRQISQEGALKERRLLLLLELAYSRSGSIKGQTEAKGSRGRRCSSDRDRLRHYRQENILSEGSCSQIRSFASKSPFTLETETASDSQLVPRINNR